MVVGDGRHVLRGVGGLSTGYEYEYVLFSIPFSHYNAHARSAMHNYYAQPGNMVPRKCKQGDRPDQILRPNLQVITE